MDKLAATVITHTYLGITCIVLAQFNTVYVESDLSTLINNIIICYLEFLKVAFVSLKKYVLMFNSNRIYSIKYAA